jgi:beta-galactosidase
VAKEQFLLVEKPATKLEAGTGTSSVQESDQNYQVITGKETITIEKATGHLISWKHEDRELLKEALKPYFWKPATENQKHNNYNRRLGAWRNAGEEMKTIASNVSKQDGCILLSFEKEMEIGAKYTLTYQINNEGKVLVRADYQPTSEKLPLMPKFGMKMLITPDMDAITWYGRGIHENYPDRKSSEFIGECSLPLSDFVVNYPAPQENGNRCDVRWMSFSDGKLNLRVEGLQPLCFRAWPWLESDIEKAAHPFELPENDFINVDIDLNIHGVGCNDGWGAQTLEKYTINANQPYSYGFILSCEEMEK